MIDVIPTKRVHSVPDFDGFYSFPPQKDKTITILGSSKSTKALEEYEKASADITRHFVKNGYNVLHGCGTNGIMGSVYKAAAEVSQKKNGIPSQNRAILKQPLWGDENLDECKIIGQAKTESERIEKFGKVSDRFLIFPGSTTTMQEATTLIQQNQYMPKNKEKKTIVLFGEKFWSGLINQYKKLFDMELLKENPIGNLFHIANTKQEVIKLLK